MDYFSSNSISSVELTSEGDLNLKYDKGGQKTAKAQNLSPELQKIKKVLEKNGTKKLTREELEKELERLEKQRKELEKGQNQEQKPTKNKPWGLIIGGGALAIVGLVGLVIAVLRKRRNKSKKY